MQLPEVVTDKGVGTVSDSGGQPSTDGDRWLWGPKRLLGPEWREPLAHTTFALTANPVERRLLETAQC